ncbi:ubiquitin-protein ligase [Striga asiatica]|uniref:Ubiquitin-protein ligase n=1 Tax=Striga asiatica TaxID=4170 RepID=A0A5A7QWY2_STRAF|nr:ubiquitin-protein ligase [Striga asiatica]
MWSNLPFDLLENIFTYLPPDSLARAKAACRSWHVAAESVSTSAVTHRHSPWFLALPTQSWSLPCYLHNPIADTWHSLPLDATANAVKPIAAVGGLLLSKFASSTSLQLAIVNPLTKQLRALPALKVPRTNPAVGIVESCSNQTAGFKIYIAGGMSAAKIGGGAAYQQTVEVYDSSTGGWETIGKMPFEIAVRLTVWTPNESVPSNGTLYWMTSARAYSVVGLDVSTCAWRELSVPMADELVFAALVPRNGKVALAGGTCGGDGGVWELRDDEGWSMIGKVPIELGVRLLGVRANWGRVKCVGVEGAVCLYRDLGSGMIVCRDAFGDGDWEWDWIDGCCSIGGRQIGNFPVRGFFIYPNLNRDGF